MKVRKNIVNRIVLLVVASVLALGAIRTAQAAGKPQSNCPVMGGKINKNVYIDYQGQRIYFCCPGCIGAFKKNPAKYMKKLADAGVALEPAQQLCPVMGRKINPSIYTDYNGRRVYFCCQGCVRAFKKNPEKYLKKLDAGEKARKGSSPKHHHH